MSERVVVAGAFVALGAFVVLAYRQGWQWTGLPAAPAETSAEKRSAKTLWDWLQLLGIPVSLALLAFLLSDAQSRRDERRAVRENTLQTYLAQMSDLMLHRELLGSKPGADVRKVARTATLTAVRRLDGPRKGLVVQFLAEARLIDIKNGTAPKVMIASADLTRVALHRADLGYTNLRDAVLIGADLREASLGNADLSDADLSEASLAAVVLSAANLSGTQFSRATLTGAKLQGAYLGYAHLRDADLRKADLRYADLRNADLRNADLREANLRGTHLLGADLSGANLSQARGVDMTGSRGRPAAGP